MARKPLGGGSLVLDPSLCPSSEASWLSQPLTVKASVMPVRPHHPQACPHIQIHPPAPCPALCFLNDPARLPHASLPLNSSPLCSQCLSLRWRTPAHPAEPTWRVPRPPAPASPSGSIQARLVSLASHPWSSQSSSGDSKLACCWVSWSCWTRRWRSAAEPGPGSQQGLRKPS